MKKVLDLKKAVDDGKLLTTAEQRTIDSLQEGLNFLAGKKAKVTVEQHPLRATRKELKAFRQAMGGITQAQAAVLLDVSYETWKSWELVRNPVTGPASRWIFAALKEPDKVAGILNKLLAAA